MIAFSVIGGYLGAGKTTLLNHILADNQGIRFALVINDFGAINIDADLIESQTDSQINLTNGCVCCSISDGFHDAMEQLQKLDPPPQHIIVEASGVADVVSLAQYGRAPGLQLDGVLVLADAETIMAKAKDKYVGKTIQRQLAYADLIVLNKIDLVADARLEEIKAWLSLNYPSARLLEAEYASIPFEVLLGVERRSSAGQNHKHDHDHHGPHGHEAYATWQYQSDKPVGSRELAEFVSALPAFVIRAKGFVLTKESGVRSVQVVGSRKEIDPIDRNVNGVSLIAIGLEQHFKSSLLDELATKLF